MINLLSVPVNPEATERLRAMVIATSGALVSTAPGSEMLAKLLPALELVHAHSLDCSGQRWIFSAEQHALVLRFLTRAPCSSPNDIGRLARVVELFRNAEKIGGPCLPAEQFPIPPVPPPPPAPPAPSPDDLLAAELRGVALPPAALEQSPEERIERLGSVAAQLADLGYPELSTSVCRVIDAELAAASLAAEFDGPPPVPPAGGELESAPVPADEKRGDTMPSPDGGSGGAPWEDQGRDAERPDMPAALPELTPEQAEGFGKAVGAFVAELRHGVEKALADDDRAGVQAAITPPDDARPEDS